MGQAVLLDETTLEIVRGYAQAHGLSLDAAIRVLVRLGNEPRVRMRRRDGAWVFDGPGVALPSGDNHALCTPCSMTPGSSSPAA